MTAPRFVLALGLAFGVAACRIGTAVPQYTANYRATTGNAFTAPGTAKGFTSTLVYREYNGPLGMLLLLSGAMPRRPKAEVVITPGGYSDPVCDGSTCTSTYTPGSATSTVPTTEELAQYDREVKAYNEIVAPAILAGAARMEVEIEVSRPELGGDTTGYSMGAYSWLRRSALASSSTLGLKVGFRMSWLQMHDRRIQELIGDATSAHRQALTNTAESAMFGAPVRVNLALPKLFAVYGGVDLNLLTLLGARKANQVYYPLLTRFGVETLRSHIRLAIELQIDGVHTSSRGLALEAGVAF